MSEQPIKLSPCPYCGSALRINSYTKRIGKAAPMLFQTAQVKCKKQSCGMSGPLAKGEGSRQRAAKAFTDAWERRA